MADRITFFESYYEAIAKINDPADRLMLYDAICEYGLKGTVPDNLCGVAEVVFTAIKPTIDTSGKRREGGAKGGSIKSDKLACKNGKASLRESDKLACEDCVSDKEKEMEMEMEMEKEMENGEDDSSDSNESESPARDAERALSKSAETVIAEWNKLADVGLKPVTRLSDAGKRKTMLYARLRQYGESQMLNAINRIRGSDFLLGKNRRGWTITFDWFLLPSNFPKVAEGNYDNVGRDAERTESEVRSWV